MHEFTFSALVAAGSFIAGLLGSLTGLGGGVVIVPLLTLMFGVDMHYAMGASLVSVIATSSGSAAAYVRGGYSNVRIGLFLEIATTAGAMLGALCATRVPTSYLAIVLGLVLLYSALAGSRKEMPVKADAGEKQGFLKLDGTLPTPEGPVPYRAKRIPLAFGLMGLAGTLSGLLGIGSGAIKVLAMDWAMGLPFKVSTTTSNFMIGVTAAASAGIYLRNGYIQPGLAMPVLLGVLGGSLLGAKILVTEPSQHLRTVFRFVIGALAAELIYNGVKGKNLVARWTEADIDPRMGTLLKWGVIVATAVTLIGATVFLIHNGKTVSDYKTFRTAASPLESVKGIVEAARRGDGSGLILLAVLLIIATPIARVIFAAYAFARIRDWLYVAVSLTVLALLLFAIIHSA